jgi:hypothetical protein
MATEKKTGDDEDQSQEEEIIEQRDPDEAVFAEDAIHHYAGEVLQEFQHAVESAMGQLNAYLSSENQDHAFDDRAFLEELGANFLAEMMQVFGGKDTPIAQAVFSELDGQIDMAARGSDVSTFVDHLSMAARDAGWYLRDNLQSVLSGHWDHLRDLAYEGSTDFIHALHQLGLPKAHLKGKEISTPLIHVAKEHRQKVPQTKEPSEKDQEQQKQLDDEEQKKREEELVAQLLEDQTKKEVMLD